MKCVCDIYADKCVNHDLKERAEREAVSEYEQTRYKGAAKARKAQSIIRTMVEDRLSEYNDSYYAEVLKADTKNDLYYLLQNASDAFMAFADNETLVNFALMARINDIQAMYDSLRELLTEHSDRKDSSIMVLQMLSDIRRRDYTVAEQYFNEHIGSYKDFLYSVEAELELERDRVQYDLPPGTKSFHKPIFEDRDSTVVDFDSMSSSELALWAAQKLLPFCISLIVDKSISMSLDAELDMIFNALPKSVIPQDGTSVIELEHFRQICQDFLNDPKVSYVKSQLTSRVLESDSMKSFLESVDSAMAMSLVSVVRHRDAFDNFKIRVTRIIEKGTLDYLNDLDGFNMDEMMALSFIFNQVIANPVMCGPGDGKIPAMP